RTNGKKIEVGSKHKEEMLLLFFLRGGRHRRDAYYKNKETASQPLSGKYIFSLSHILWESIPY
ncbi:hypothetical protein AAH132_07645, partial [Bacteroides ovatus]|uniref:hypothetical protein n=1 Tax=Bacteroides ovatus TaxID=28116 RepID=UPI003219C143